MDHLIEIVPPSELHRRHGEEIASGRTVVEAFVTDEEGWPIAARVICVGTVATEEQAEAAVLAAVRGASLVIAVTLEGPPRQRLIEDLANLGPVVSGAGDVLADSARPAMTSEEQALVDHVTGGASVIDAARQVGLSVRSAHRRFAALRARLGVTTNSELLMRVNGERRDQDALRPRGTDAARGGPRFWARQDDLADLDSRLAAGRHVVVVGEAGMGKTTLLRASVSPQSARAVAGGALSTLQWMPYLALIRATGPPPAGADAAAVALHVIERVGDGILVLDDLQWADTGTLALLPRLADHLQLLAAVRAGDPGTAAALAAMREAGAESIHLSELPPPLAAAVVRARRPGLSDEELTSVLGRAGGNPLLLEELADDASPTLRASLLGRLDRLGDDARAALIRLALLGGLAEPHLVGDGLDALVEVGLARRSGDLAVLRHDLIGTEALELLDEPERRRFHAELAARLPPAEAARHHLAAGDLEQARAAALRAADSAAFPGERARDLLLAATCTGGAVTSRDAGTDVPTVLRAVDAFLEAGELVEARRAVDGIIGLDRGGDVALRRARVLWQAGDPEGARQAVDDGLTMAAGTGTPVEVGLRVEQLRYPIRVEFDAERALAMATQTVALAEAVGAEEARARTLLGSALLVAGSNDWDRHITAALEQARREGDLDTTFEASNALVAAHMLAGDRTLARRFATEAAALARTTHRRHWEEQFTVTANLLALMAGACHEVAAWGRAFVRPHLTVAVHVAYAVHAIALADLGYGRDALGVLAEGKALPTGDATGASLLRWAEAETLWLTGQPDRAVVAADECIERGAEHFPVRPLAGALRAWIELDLGRPPRIADRSGWAFAAAATSESRGVALLAAGEPTDAIACFEEAAALAADAPRFALRASWGAGEAERRAGRLDAALARLLAVEAEAESLGFLALAGRVRRSLRQAGHPGAGTGACGQGVTPRQQQVLALVAEGHTSSEIAALLGVRTTTVETHIRAAMERLGATTRGQAALRVIDRPGVERSCDDESSIDGGEFPRVHPA